MVFITTQKIQVVLEYVQKGLAKTREGYKNFNRGMAITTGRMKELQTSQGRWNRRMTESRTRVGRMALGLRKATHGMRGFRMEMLGVMFFGMMLLRTFSGLLRVSLEWTGVNEIMTASLGILFLPVAEWVLEWAIKFLNWVLTLTESQKKWIGSLVVLGIVLGAALFLLGTFALGIGSVILALGALLSPIALVLAGFVALAGFFILKDFFKDTADASDELKTKLMGFGVSGEAFDKVKDKAVGALPKIKEFFIGLKDKIGTWLAETLPIIIKSGADFILSLAKGIIDNVDRIASAITTLIRDIVGFISDNLPMIIDSAVIILNALINGLIENKEKIAEAMEEIIEAMGTWIGDNSDKILSLGLAIAKGIISGITKGLLKLGWGIGETVASFVTGKPKESFVQFPGFPEYQHGGIVPGRPGSPVPILAHAGERISPVGGANSTAGTIIINAEYNVTVSDKREFESMLRENNIRLAEDVRRIVKT